MCIVPVYIVADFAKVIINNYLLSRSNYSLIFFKFTVCKYEKYKVLLSLIICDGDFLSATYMWHKAERIDHPVMLKLTIQS